MGGPDRLSRADMAAAVAAACGYDPALILAAPAASVRLPVVLPVLHVLLVQHGIHPQGASGGTAAAGQGLYCGLSVLAPAPVVMCHLCNLPVAACLPACLPASLAPCIERPPASLPVLPPPLQVPRPAPSPADISMDSSRLEAAVGMQARAPLHLLQPPGSTSAPCCRSRACAAPAGECLRLAAGWL